jgi:hypothetical protein
MSDKHTVAMTLNKMGVQLSICPRCNIPDDLHASVSIFRMTVFRIDFLEYLCTQCYKEYLEKNDTYSKD